MTRTTPSLLALSLTACLTLCLTACGGGGGSADPNQSARDGRVALAAGDTTAAARHFDAALRSLQRDDPAYLNARMGSIEALCALAPARVPAEVKRAAAEGVLQPEDFISVARELAEGDHFDEADQVFRRGLDAFPDDATLDEFGYQLTELAQAAGSKAEGALASLSGLGYVK